MGMLRSVAVLAGVAWVVGVTLIGTQADTDPVGARYDAANRALTPALCLVLLLAVLLHGAAVGRMRLGVRLLAAAATLLLAGNVVEFWLVLAGDGHTEKTATRLGVESEFWGSEVGWMGFLAGLLLALAAIVVLASAAGLRRGVPLGLLGVGGLLSTALWAVSPLAAAAAGAGFAGWLLLVTQLVEPAPSAMRRPSLTTSR